MRKLQMLTLALFLLFAKYASLSEEKNDDAALLKVRRSVWIKWLENDQVATEKARAGGHGRYQHGRTRDQTPDGRAASRRGISRRRRKIDQPRISENGGAAISGCGRDVERLCSGTGSGRKARENDRPCRGDFCEAQRAVDQSGLAHGFGEFSESFADILMGERERFLFAAETQYSPALMRSRSRCNARVVVNDAPAILETHKDKGKNSAMLPFSRDKCQWLERRAASEPTAWTSS